MNAVCSIFAYMEGGIKLNHQERELTHEELQKRIEILTSPAYNCGKGCACVPEIFVTLQEHQKQEILRAYTLMVDHSARKSSERFNLLHYYRNRIPSEERNSGWFEPLMHVMKRKGNLPANTIVSAIIDALLKETNDPDLEK